MLCDAPPQVLAMEVERFTVPEVLFRPSDIGLKQAGVVEALHQAIEACDVGLRGGMYANIVLTGGNARLPGYRERVERELRAVAPDVYDVKVTLPEDPVTYAWSGGSRLAADSAGFSRNVITKAQYDEMGWERVEREFANW
jgi:actin-related protein 6